MSIPVVVAPPAAGQVIEEAVDVVSTCRARAHYPSPANATITSTGTSAAAGAS
jgi:hypothetical protein